MSTTLNTHRVSKSNERVALGAKRRRKARRGENNMNGIFELNQSSRRAGPNYLVNGINEILTQIFKGRIYNQLP